MSRFRHLRLFEEISGRDVLLVGGKNASLGEMVRELTPEGIKVPNGFAVTAQAYWNLLRTSGLEQYIKDTLRGLDTRDTAQLRQRGSAARHAIMGATLAITARERNESTARLWRATLIAAIPGLLLLALVLYSFTRAVYSLSR